MIKDFCKHKLKGRNQQFWLEKHCVKNITKEANKIDRDP